MYKFNFNSLLRTVVYLIVFVFYTHGIPLWGSTSPSDIVSKYCKLDYNGERTPIGDINKMDDYMKDGKDYDEPGWDRFIIVSEYKVLEENYNGDGTVTIPVEYTILATLNSSPQLVLEQKKNIKVENITLVKVNDTWKIKKYIIFPRISPGSAIKLVNGWCNEIKNKSIYQGEKLDNKRKNDLLYNLNDMIKKINRLDSN
ncbi:MAG: hypothetical protein ABSA71_10355 [Desulfomonilia bacterium]|jgi:hypothetical protein